MKREEQEIKEDTIRKTEGKPEEKGTKIIREEEMKEKDKREDIKGTKKEKIWKKTNQSLTEIVTKEETKIIDQEITTKLKEADIHLIRSQKNIWKIRTAV